MHTHKDDIDATLSDTKVYLDKLHQEISKTLEKVASREKYINNQVTRNFIITALICATQFSIMQLVKGCELPRDFHKCILVMKVCALP